MEKYRADIEIEIHEEFLGESEDEVRREIEDALDEIPFDVSYEITIS